MSAWERITALFGAARDLSPDDREAFLDVACADDTRLRRDVEALLNDASADDGFLDQPVIGAGLIDKLSIAYALAPGVLLKNRYQIQGLLGAGGQADVYLATDTLLSRHVVIKVVRVDADAKDALKASFEDEKRVLARIDHPAVVGILDVGSLENGIPYLVIQHVDGLSLRELLQRGPLDVVRAARIVREVGRALSAVHAAGVAHQDLKPENIMVQALPDATEAIKLIDFGIARMDRTGLTAGGDADDATGAGVIAGSVRYMAPEQFAGLHSKAADVYALGLVACELLSGQPDIRALPRRFGSRVRPHLERALAYDPEQRPDVRVWADQLATLLRANRSPARWRRVLAFAGVLAVAVATWFAATARRTPPLTDRDTIVLADFVNTTGDSVFDGTLKQGLAVKLLQSPFLNVLPDQAIVETLKLMGLKPGDPLPPSRAREVCLRTNGKAVLIGSISRIGNAYVVGLHAQDCQSGADLAREQAQAPRKEDVLKALNDVSDKARRALGEARNTVEKYNAPLEQATTSSLEALQAYSLGITRFLESGDAAAVVFHKRAIELDPQFAMAYVQLGGHYGNLLEHTLSTQSYEKAYTLRDRSSQRERYRIEAEYYVFVTGEVERANLVYEQWARAYPHDFKAFGRLARNRMLIGQLEEAVVPSLEALRLNPGAISQWYNLINLYLALNRLGDAKAAYAHAIANQPGHTRLHFLKYFIAFLEGDADEMRRQSESARGHTGDEDQELSMRADTEAYFGRLANARKLRREATAIAEQDGRQDAVATYLVTGALAEAETGDAANARKLPRAALRLTSSTELQAMAALALARAGEIRRAGELADELRQGTPRGTLIQGFWLPTIRAAMSLHRHQPNVAVDTLETATKYERAITYTLGGTLYPAYVRGEAYLQAGRPLEAITEFRKVLDSRGLVSNAIVGALSHLQLARAKALNADRAGAREAYDQFFALWHDADPDVPVLRSARNEFAKLPVP